MSETKVTISVPTGLNNLGNLAQQIVSDLREDKPWMAIVSGAMPVLFAEGARFEDLKAEAKSPAAIVLAGLVLGGIVAKLVEKKVAANALALAEKNQPALDA